MKRSLTVVGLWALIGLVWLCAGCKTPTIPAEHSHGWVVGGSAGGYGTILHTTDYGATWVRQGDSTVIPAVALQGISADDDEHVWASGQPADSFGTILYTSNGGTTWVRQGDSSTIPDAAFLGVSAADAHTVWVAGSSGAILKTTNGGTTWFRQAQGVLPTAIFQSVYAFDRNVVWVVGQDSGGNGAPIILHTTDGGGTWTRQGQESLPAKGSFIDVHAASPTTAWAVGTEMGFRTTDGGEHWVSKAPSAGIGHVNGVCVVNEQAVWLAVDYSGAYFTPNAGDTWIKQNTPGRGSFCMNIGVTATHPDTVWMTTIAVGPGVILHTVDGGANWVEQLRTDSAGLGNVGLRRITFAGAAR